MNKVQTLRSYALWRTRERTRYARWRRAVKKYKQGHHLRAKFYDEYVEARNNRQKRLRELKNFEVVGIDAAGLRDIRREEGFRTKPYNDSAGHCTVGVGHLIHRGGCSAADYRNWTMSEKEVDALLAKDLDRFEKVVRDTFKGAGLKVTQNRFNACVSLAFNIGEGGFRSSTVAKKIREGNKIAAADAFLLWDNPPELRGRRERERRLFLS